jgi:Na+-driven multidrug efflux pump
VILTSITFAYQDKKRWCVPDSSGLIEECELVIPDAIGTGAEALASQQFDGLEQLLDALTALAEGGGLLLELGALFAALLLGFSELIAQLLNDPLQLGRVIREAVSGRLQARYFTRFR